MKQGVHPFLVHLSQTLEKSTAMYLLFLMEKNTEQCNAKWQATTFCLPLLKPFLEERSQKKLQLYQQSIITQDDRDIIQSCSATPRILKNFLTEANVKHWTKIQKIW